MRYVFNIFFILLFNLVCIGQIKTYQIGYLLDKSSVGIDSMILKLSNEIKVVVGEDAIVEFNSMNRLVNNLNATTALKQYESLLANETDIIIAFGAVNNLVITKQRVFKKPTILFGSVSEELLEKIPQNTASLIPNFTSIVTRQSYEEDLGILKSLVSPTKVGVFVEKAYMNYPNIESKFDQFESNLGMDISLEYYDSTTDIIKNLKDYDAIYLVAAYYFTSNEVRNLADVFIEKGIPSLSSSRLQNVKDGMLATNHDNSEIDQFFRRIALSVESYITNTKFTEVASVLEFNKNLTINFNTANKLGVPLKYSLIATTNFVGDATSFEAEQNYSLIDIMERAISENLDLKVKRNDIYLADSEVKLAKSNYLPDVFLSATGVYVDPELAKVSNGASPEWTTAGSVSLNQTVFSESANANITIQEALQHAQQENYNSEELNTVFDASSLYFNALILKANYRIQSQNLELTKRNLEISTQNYEAGESGKSDVLRFRSEMSQNMQVTIESLNQLKQGYFELNQVLNNPIDLIIDVDDAEFQKGVFSNYNYEQLGVYLDDPRLRKKFVEFLVEEAKTNAPELKFLNYNLMATQRSERLYGGGRFLPTLAIQGEYSYTFNRTGEGSTFPVFLAVPPDGYYNVGLSLSVPLFNQNKQNINKQIAQVQQDQINSNIESINLTIEKNINDAAIQLVNQLANIELSKVFEETAKEALELTQVSYANGAVNIVQLLDAQNNFLQAKLSRTNATYNYLLSSMQLERYIGNFFLLQTEDERQEFITRFLEYTQNN